MSIASEITRINNNIASAYTACSNKGATMPATQNSANLATTISSISGGGGGGATIYNSETEMNSSTGHSDGDLANVYQVPSSITSSSSFRYGFFPDKVVLSQAITSNYSIDFEGDGDQYYSCYLSQNYVTFAGSDAEYNDVEITYRSKDGLTFFRINGEDYLDLGEGTHKTTGEWLDACGSFIKIGDELFGFYRYGHSVEDKTQQKIPIASNTTFDSTNLTCTCTLTGSETVIDGYKLQELIKKAFVKFDIPELDYMGIFTKSDGVYACYYKRVLSNNRTFYGGINTRCINSTGTNFTDYVMDANGQMGTNQTFTLYYFKLDFENMDISAQTSVSGEMHQTGVGYYNFPMFEVTGMTSAPAYFIVKSKYLLAGEAHTSDINFNTASVFTTSPSMTRTYDGFETLANNKNGVITSSGGGGITPTGNINITDTNVTNVTNYATAQVVDSNLTAENIKKDVTVLGITGSYEGGGSTPTGTINITTNGTVDVTNYANASVAVTNYVPDGYIEHSIQASNWTDHTLSFNASTVGKTVDITHVSIGLSANSTLQNTTDIVNAKISVVQKSYDSSNERINMMIRALNIPTNTITLAIFGVTNS